MPKTYTRTRLDRIRRRLALRLYALALAFDVFAGRVSGLPRLAGGSPEGDGEGEGAGAGTGQGEDGEGEGDGDGDGAPEGEGEPDPDADPNADAASDDELRQNIAALQARLDEREQREASEARAAREAAGEWEQLYREEKDAREKAEAEARNGQTERLILAAAKGAHNPARVAALIDASKITTDVEARRAVDELRRTDPYLFAKRGRQQADAGQQPGTPATPPAKNGDDSNGTRPRRPVDRMAAGYAANNSA